MLISMFSPRFELGRPVRMSVHTSKLAFCRLCHASFPPPPQLFYFLRFLSRTQTFSKFPFLLTCVGQVIRRPPSLPASPLLLSSGSPLFPVNSACFWTPMFFPFSPHKFLLFRFIRIFGFLFFFLFVFYVFCWVFFVFVFHLVCFCFLFFFSYPPTEKLRSFKFQSSL